MRSEIFCPTANFSRFHQNEEAIGEAIKGKIDEGRVKREDLFITSKLWCTFHSKEKVLAGFQATLKAC